MRLKDKVCIITGGGSGIGRATSLLFADEGARLVLADKHGAKAQTVASECSGKGAQAVAVGADVAITADVKRMMQATVERFRRLDVLVNNAGYGIPGSVVETDEDAWDALMAVNVRGGLSRGGPRTAKISPQGPAPVPRGVDRVADVGCETAPEPTA